MNRSLIIPLKVTNFLYQAQTYLHNYIDQISSSLILRRRHAVGNFGIKIT